MNVLDLPGPEFLRLYLVLLATAVAIAFLLRWWLRQPGDDLPPRQLPDLHPFEIAYLVGGPSAVTDAAIANLVHRSRLVVMKRTGRLRPANPDADGPIEDATPLEQAVYQAFASQPDGGVDRVRRAVRGTARSAAARLESLGLVLPDTRALLVRLAPAGALLALLALGVLKVAVGIDRDRPVQFLIALCVATAGGAVAFAAVPAHRTRRGARVLASLKRENAALRTTASRAPSSLAGDDLAMTLALFSAGAFAFGPMSDVDRALSPRRARQDGHSGSSCGSGSSSSGSTCGGNSGSSGGGGGGGSSCGGGCGGCGGCGGGG